MERECNHGENCPNHDELGKTLQEVRDDFYRHQDTQIKTDAVCKMQIDQNTKDIEELNISKNHCKAHALSNIRNSIVQTKDDICGIIDKFKTESRNSLKETREDFIVKVTKVYALTGITGLIIMILVGVVVRSNADVEGVKTRQNTIEVANKGIQADVKYLKEGLKSLSTKQDILDRKYDTQTAIMQQILNKLDKK